MSLVSAGLCFGAGSQEDAVFVETDEGTDGVETKIEIGLEGVLVNRRNLRPLKWNRKRIYRVQLNSTMGCEPGTQL